MGRRHSSTVFDFGTRQSWVVSLTPRALYLRWKSPRYPMDKRICDPRADLDVVEHRKKCLALPGIELGRPTRSSSLNWLIYLGSLEFITKIKVYITDKLNKGGGKLTNRTLLLNLSATEVDWLKIYMYCLCTSKSSAGNGGSPENVKFGSDGQVKSRSAATTCCFTWPTEDSQNIACNPWWWRSAPTLSRILGLLTVHRIFLPTVHKFKSGSSSREKGSSLRCTGKAPQRYTSSVPLHFFNNIC